MKTTQPNSKESEPKAHGKSPDSGAHRAGPRGLAASLLALQRTHGNRFVQQMTQSNLTISPPNDQYEQEADRVAQQTMKASEDDSLARKRENEILPARAVSREPTKGIPEANLCADALGCGQPLPKAVRNFFEMRLGTDLSSVLVYDNARAAESAEALNAAAYTLGRNVVFAAGKYTLGTSEGRQLLAHELVHVVHPYRDSTSDPNRTLMRKVAVPSEDDIQKQTIELRLRLTSLLQQASIEGTTTAELAEVQERLAWWESLASETDPTRQKILFISRRVRELRDDLVAAPQSSERERIGQEIHADELELARALEISIRNLEKDLASLYELANRAGPPEPELELQKKISFTETELRENETKLRLLKRIFTSEKAATVAQKYKTKVKPLPGGGCMTAVYEGGLAGLYTPSESTAVKNEVYAIAEQKGEVLVQKARKSGITNKKELERIRGIPNDVDLIMETLRRSGKAGEKVVVRFRFNEKTKKATWVPSVEKTVLEMIKPEFPGWYFFGLSLSGGYHSVILAVDNSDGRTAQIYWMDQYSRGFTKNVTGGLEKEMADWKPDYGLTDSTLWPLLPTPETVIEVE
jgi:hypothetical protein